MPFKSSETVLADWQRATCLVGRMWFLYLCSMCHLFHGSLAWVFLWRLSPAISSFADFCCRWRILYQATCVLCCAGVYLLPSLVFFTVYSLGRLRACPRIILSQKLALCGEGNYGVGVCVCMCTCSPLSTFAVVFAATPYVLCDKA